MAGGRWLHVSPHVLAPTGQFGFISPLVMDQPDVCLCSQPLNQSSFALFSLDCTGLLLFALELWSSLTCQLELLLLSLQLFPLNPSIRFLSTFARFPVSLVAGLSFLFPYPVFLLCLLSSWDTAGKICWFVCVPALTGRVRPMCTLKDKRSAAARREGCMADLGRAFQRFRGAWVRQPCPWGSPLFLRAEQEAWPALHISTAVREMQKVMRCVWQLCSESWYDWLKQGLSWRTVTLSHIELFKSMFLYLKRDEYLSFYWINS